MIMSLLTPYFFSPFVVLTPFSFLPTNCTPFIRPHSLTCLPAASHFFSQRFNTLDTTFIIIRPLPTANNNLHRTSKGKSSLSGCCVLTSLHLKATIRNKQRRYPFVNRRDFFFIFLFVQLDKDYRTSKSVPPASS
ncbi:hypothetical protein BKA57DRAFT_476895 [Linnemannia elongata]|nr:hypothetical protein BKA57DRAFT_476895 [Linnemannia elongata]